MALDFSSEIKASSLVYPKNNQTNPLTSQDVDLFGVLVNADYDGLNVNVDGSILFSQANIDHIDITIDQQNNPFCSYSVAGDVFIYWFDPLAGEYVSNNLSLGSEPKCYLIGRRGEQNSQILVSYRLGSQVFVRDQLDRFSVATLVPMSRGARKLIGAALGENNRLIWVAV